MNNQKSLAGGALMVNIHHSKAIQTWLRRTIVVVCISSLCFSCSSPTPQATPQPTTQPPTEQLPTDTPIPSDTPEPTTTTTPTSSSTPDLTATAGSKSTQTVAAMLDDIDAELQMINLSTDQGFLGWSSTMPVSLTVDTYLEDRSWIIESDQTFTDFVLKTDVTWLSSSGLAVCGIVFRAEDDLEDGAQYKFLTLRLSGLPAWEVDYYKYGQVQSTILGGMSSAINQEQGSTNRYLLVVQGDKITIYANRAKLGSVTNSILSEGLLAFYVLQESGETTCFFSDSWVWVLDESSE
jgi:hypothetical protein